MRFIGGSIPDDSTFEPTRPAWNPLREPSPWIAQLIALPIGFVAAWGVVALWKASLGQSWSDLEPIVVLLGVPAFILLVPVHEMVHLVLHPRQGRSPRSLVGIWPAKLLFYAHYEGELEKRRFLLILAGPFIVLTVLPVAIGIASGVDQPFYISFTVMNALGACMDLFGLGLIGLQVPAGSFVRNKGYSTWWRSPA